jgi:hypothetical protein
MSIFLMISPGQTSQGGQHGCPTDDRPHVKGRNAQGFDAVVIGARVPDQYQLYNLQEFGLRRGY